MSETQTCHHVRWMVRRDMPAVLAAEETSFEDPLGEQEIIRHLRDRNTIGMVVGVGEQVAGWMMYSLSRRIDLLRFCVHEDFRYQGVGTALIEKIISKVHERRPRVLCEVNERFFAAHLLLKHCGFQAIDVLRKHFENGDDAYVFQFKERNREC